MKDYSRLPVTKLLGIKIIKYRIVRDNYLGYEAQKWRIWFPIWIQIGFTNTHYCLEDAIKYCWCGDVIVES